jgi:hypothetical protein
LSANIVEFLTSPNGQEARQTIVTDLSKSGKAADSLTLKWQSKLRAAGYSTQEACLVIEQVCLEQLQGQREVFRDSADYLYLRDALEQCSTWRLAAHRARYLQGLCQKLSLSSDALVEVGCGIGGDSLELSRLFKMEIYELDPTRASIAQHNLSQHPDRQFNLVAGDFLEISPERFQGRPLFIDPGRRKLDKSGQMKRIFDPEQYQPPLSQLLSYGQQSQLLCIKAAPGLPDEAVEDLECELEFVSHQRTCKEAVIWAYPGASGRKATILTSDDTFLEYWQSEVESMTAPEVGRWIHEPDPAILRAHALGQLAQQIEAGLLQREIGYLVSENNPQHPACQSFEILEILPLNQAQIRKACTRHEFGILEIKKRGVPIEPDQYRQGLKLDSKKFRKSGVLILTRYQDERIAFLCRRA